MSDEAIREALERGNNNAAAKAAGDSLPESLRRDPVYGMVFAGGLVVLGALVAAFLI